MFNLVATIFSVYWIVEHKEIVIVSLVVLLLLIVFLVRRRNKRISAYLALPIISIGNRETKTYHSVGCQTLKKAKPQNLVNFRTNEEITRSGYRPCGSCMRRSL